MQRQIEKKWINQINVSFLGHFKPHIPTLSFPGHLASFKSGINITTFVQRCEKERHGGRERERKRKKERQIKRGGERDRERMMGNENDGV